MRLTVLSMKIYCIIHHIRVFVKCICEKKSLMQPVFDTSPFEPDICYDLIILAYIHIYPSLRLFLIRLNDSGAIPRYVAIYCCFTV